jgi:hypothetical protein
VVIGHVSYYVYLLSCTAVVIAASAPEGARALVMPWMLVKNIGRLIVDLVTLDFGMVFTSVKHLVTSPWLLGCLIGGFLVSYLLELLADRRMSAVFSQFWHEVHPELRRALKRARKTAAAAQDRT